MTSYHQAVLEEIEVLKSKIAPLSSRLTELNREIERLNSVEFIKQNGITKDAVQMSSGDGIPWHGTFYEFGLWMKREEITKPWCEWNGYIFPTEDAKKQIMGAGIARIEHL